MRLEDERVVFKDVAGHPRYLVVCAVGPGDRSTTVRSIRADLSWTGNVSEEVMSTDLCSVPLPISKRGIYDTFSSHQFPPHVMHRLAKDLRRASVRVAEKSWDDTLPPNVVAWAEDELRRHMGDEPCCDNSRVARMGISSQMRRFRRQESIGCCGFATFERVGPDGNRYILGYNYGH